MRRRIAIALVLTTCSIAPAALHAQTAPPPATQTPTATQPPAGPFVKVPPLAFSGETGLVFTPVLTTQTGIFEEVMGKVREALTQSKDPLRQQQAAGWKLYKATEPYNTHVLYVSVMDPAVPAATYSVFDLLKESLGDMPARELFEKFRAAHAAPQHVLNLTAAPAPAPEPAK